MQLQEVSPGAENNEQSVEISSTKIPAEQSKKNPDEEQPSILGTPPDIFNAPKADKAEQSKPVDNALEFLDDAPKN